MLPAALGVQWPRLPVRATGRQGWTREGSSSKALAGWSSTACQLHGPGPWKPAGAADALTAPEVSRRWLRRERPTAGARV